MCGMKLLIHSQTETVPWLEFWNKQSISFHTLLGMWLLINAGIKVKPCEYKGPSVIQKMGYCVFVQKCHFLQENVSIKKVCFHQPLC